MPQQQAEMFEDNRMFEPQLKTVEERVEAAAKFIVERHKIFLRRASGMERPWTKDPILRNYKFTNIYRELDPGTTWIINNVIEPYEKNKNLWFMVAVSRLINWPDSLQELMDERAWPVETYNAVKTYRVLDERAKRGDKVITGAYIVNSVPPKGVKCPDSRKVYCLPHYSLQSLWVNRDNLSRAAKVSMEAFVTEMTKCHGWGAFLSYQVAVDLSYSKKWLGNAPDYNTFTSPGPGTTKGMNWLMNGELSFKLGGKKLNKHMIEFRKMVNKEIRRQIPEKHYTGDFKTGFAKLSMSNFSNCNCELSKFVRSLSDNGSAMKTRYNGG